MTRTATEVFAAMGTGVNMGNTLDTARHDREPAVVERRLREHWRVGFRHVRLPVTWWPRGLGASRVDAPDFLRLVDGAVDAALRIGFVVILNAHHEEWMTDYDGSERSDALLADLWRKIATRYASRPQERLLFEILNEPHGTMCGTPRGKELLKRCNAVGHGAVRGVSRDRIVIVQPHNMADVWSARALYASPDELPGGGEDDFLALSVHSYGPPEFALPSGSNDFDFGGAADRTTALCDRLAKIVKEMQRTRTLLGVPVHLGEFGVGREREADRDHPLVHAYYRTLPRLARAATVPATVWDDGTGNRFCMTRFDADGRDVSYPFGLVSDVLSAGASAAVAR